MFKTLKINKFCNSLISQINNKKPQRIVEFLSSQGVFYEDTATLLSLYTFGYCLGALDFYFETIYSSEIHTRIRRCLCKKYLLFVRKNLFNSNVSQQRKNILSGQALMKNNFISEFVTFLLKKNDDCYELLASHYLETIQVSSLFINDIDQFNLEIKDLLSFSSFPRI